MKKSILALALAIATIQIGCKQSNETSSGTLSSENLEKAFMEKLLTAKDGDVIQLPEGSFNFNRSLSLEAVPNVTLKGAGLGKTILSFKGQIEGAQGLLLKDCENLTLEGFSVQDTKGDAIKAHNCKNITMRGLETTWTGGPKKENGGYGLYPVSCTNVLMENCEASYASDAGIYVGQSTNVVVRNNYAHHNVAGIEIENTRNADVHNNRTMENTGGLLIFDMPDLPQANGWKIKVHDNQVENNNHPNFAAPGTVVSILPPGTGLLMMAHREIEVYKNTIKGHKTLGLCMNSWLFTGRPFESKEYDPFCSAIHVHDNTFEGNTGEVDTSTDFGKLMAAVTQGKTVDIAMDGIFNPASLGDKGVPTGDAAFCFKNNGNVSFVNFNAGKGSKPEEIAKNLSTDITPFDCSLKGVDITGHDAWLTLK
jgi:parallel beta-helix repeat protein